MPPVLKIALVAVLSVLICVPAASASTAKERSQAKLIKTLKRQKASLTRQKTSLKTTLATSKSQVSTLSATINGLNAKVSGLGGALGTLTAENTALRGTLSQGVAAIARSDNMVDLRDLVLQPAYENWVCAGSFSFSTYGMSYTFDGRYTSDGTCT
jgi:septal ring factor EnvC (AmiA/AmiB activator)